jgi:hypothetical protein
MAASAAARHEMRAINDDRITGPERAAKGRA